MSGATNWAREKAAQAWCKESTKHKEMDVELAEAFAEILDEIKNEIELLYDALNEVTPALDMCRIIMDSFAARDAAGEIVRRCRALLNRRSRVSELTPD